MPVPYTSPKKVPDHLPIPTCDSKRQGSSEMRSEQCPAKERLAQIDSPVHRRTTLQHESSIIQAGTIDKSQSRLVIQSLDQWVHVVLSIPVVVREKRYIAARGKG